MRFSSPSVRRAQSWSALVFSKGCVLVGTAALAAAVLAYLGTDALVRYLPPSLAGSVNPIDVDYRALLVTTGFAGLAWILSSLPAGGIRLAREPAGLLED